MAEGIIKVLSASLLVERPDRLREGETIRVLRFATRGQTVTTEAEPESPADREANTVYGVADADFARLESLDAFYSDEELAAAEAGFTQTLPGVEGGEVPLTFEAMTLDVLAEAIKAGHFTAESLVEKAEANPALADLILQAEDLASGGEPREEVTEGVLAAIGQEAAPAPENETGGGPQPPAPADEGAPAEIPADSASRAEWDTFASSLGLDPAAYANKSDLQAAVEEAYEERA